MLLWLYINLICFFKRCYNNMHARLRFMYKTSLDHPVVACDPPAYAVAMPTGLAFLSSLYQPVTLSLPAAVVHSPDTAAALFRLLRL